MKQLFRLVEELRLHIERTLPWPPPPPPRGAKPSTSTRTLPVPRAERDKQAAGEARVKGFADAVGRFLGVPVAAKKGGWEVRAPVVTYRIAGIGWAEIDGKVAAMVQVGNEKAKLFPLDRPNSDLAPVVAKFIQSVANARGKKVEVRQIHVYTDCLLESSPI